MMLIYANPLIHMLNQFRVAHVWGGYGSGKTLLCYQLAYELIKGGRYRYILGNSNSVWTDNPEKVVLRDGCYVDAVVILDEGGLFLRMSSDADEFMLGLRKLNITILVPSVLPPSSRIKFLQIQRTLNLHTLGIPLWLYSYRLNLGFQKEKSTFAIWRPDEVYGIYDTLDYPIDDLYLSDWFAYWMATARSSRPEWCKWGPPPGIDNKIRSRNRVKRNSDAVDEVRGLVEEVIDQQEDLADLISFSSVEVAKKRNNHRR